ncbi:hypothetical protein CIHG_03487 [Coccidioides immitis H538.4]|uniref:Uncharacterized protein n=1 Tax=Coccidioides immitis H538.4 TaxID=396776 RepID=A0A0J8RM84_COCIT|nr:hypothetical protein CIHG_03487 [Coccidioides immitis H538.4]
MMWILTRCLGLKSFVLEKSSNAVDPVSKREIQKLGKREHTATACGYITKARLVRSLPTTMIENLTSFHKALPDIAGSDDDKQRNFGWEVCPADANLTILESTARICLCKSLHRFPGT